MEVADPFVPAADGAESTGSHERWNTSYGDVVADEGPYSPPNGAAKDAIGRAKELAGQLSSTVTELTQSLAESESERTAAQRERTDLQEKIRGLEQVAASKKQLRDALLEGDGAVVSSDDVTALKSLTEALTQDPDRLTTVFNVVQQASKIAAVVSVYAQMRAIVEEG